jgi:hypothetical protein
MPLNAYASMSLVAYALATSWSSDSAASHASRIRDAVEDRLHPVAVLIRVRRRIADGDDEVDRHLPAPSRDDVRVVGSATGAAGVASTLA